MYQFTHFLTYLLTYSMQRSPFWEANWFSVSQKIHRILWNLKVHIVCTRARHLSLYWASSIHSILPLPEDPLNIILPSTSGSYKWLFPSGFPTLYMPLLPLLHATCLAYLILDFITQIILGEEHRSLSSSLCSSKELL
jgi:hypothetical protein